MIRSIALALGLLLAAPAMAFDISAMSAEEREAFDAAVRDYLLANPEVIFEAVDRYEARQAALQAQNDGDVIRANAAAIFDDGVSWIGGNPAGDITVVEFLDYRCGYCRRAFDEVRELVESDGNIRFVVKEFPILGSQSTLAARFAIAVRNTAGAKSYKQVHDQLMAMRADVTPQSLKRIARDAGLNMNRIEAAMNASEVEAEIQGNYALAKELGINGTPGFVFESEMLRGYAPLETMRAIVARVRG